MHCNLQNANRRLDKESGKRSVSHRCWRFAALISLTCLVGCGSQKTSPGDAIVAAAPPNTPVMLSALPADGGRTEALVAGIAALKGQVETRVNLSFTAVTDDDLAHLEFPETVREIDLSSTRITDRGVEQLLRVRYLETLVLMDTPVTERVVEILKRMPSLCEVRLDNTQVPVSMQIDLIRFLNPRTSARSARQTAAAARLQQQQ